MVNSGSLQKRITGGIAAVILVTSANPEVAMAQMDQPAEACQIFQAQPDGNSTLDCGEQQNPQTDLAVSNSTSFQVQIPGNSERFTVGALPSDETITANPENRSSLTTEQIIALLAINSGKNTNSDPVTGVVLAIPENTTEGTAGTNDRQGLLSRMYNWEYRFGVLSLLAAYGVVKGMKSSDNRTRQKQLVR